MGPTIIIDKSVLHMLSYEEICLLDRMYTINIPEVLPYEILADLYKNNRFDSANVKELQKTAAKLTLPFMKVNVNHRELIEQSLLGVDYYNARKPIIRASKIVPEADGGYGILIEESEFSKKMSQWKAGVVNKQDAEEAFLWRKTIQDTHISNTLREFKENGLQFVKHKGVSEVLQDNIETLDYEPTQELLVKNVTLCAFDDPQMHEKVRKRWFESGKPKLKQFAPYAYYCWLIESCFIFCSHSSICGLGMTDYCDFMYTKYLPFCDLFCSDDHFHKTFVPVIKLEEQTFVTGKELKDDLANILAKLKEESKDPENLLKGFGHIKPPIDNNSFTYQMWKKYTDLMNESFSELVVRLSSLNKEKHET
jgi:hypothetical protein